MNKYKVISTRCFKTRSKLQKYLDSKDVDLFEGETFERPGGFIWIGSVLVESNSISKFCKKEIIGERIDYSMDEIQLAKLLCLEFPNVPSKGQTGPCFGNKYDYSKACPLCLSGAVLIPPFRINAKDLPKNRNVAETHMRELLVSKTIADELGGLDGSGDWLVDVEDAKKDKMLGWKSFQPSAVYPKMSPETKGLSQEISKKKSDTACLNCLRDCYGTVFETAFEPVYIKDDILNSCVGGAFGGDFPDAAGTFERIGPGTKLNIGGRQIAQPKIIISQRVARIMLRHANKWIRLTPVFLID